MAKFLVLYRAPASAQEQMSKATPEQAKAGMEAWMAWAGRAGSAIADMGSPTQLSAYLGAGKAVGDPIGGYSIVQADSLAAARKVLDGHPHLSMPGAAIEVLEFLALPGM
ncbi:MAG: hypothetical protein KBA31_20765 [Alphaproteobacteria bacterium]|nr:hypothetical protein [Alphaproteobacteria bacterium]